MRSRAPIGHAIDDVRSTLSSAYHACQVPGAPRIGRRDGNAWYTKGL